MDAVLGGHGHLRVGRPDHPEGPAPLTQQEAVERILRVWLSRDGDDFNATLLMILIICLGLPVKRSDILRVVRAYVDAQTENHTYRGKRR